VGASERGAAALIRAWLEQDDGVVLKVRVLGVTKTGELATIGTATDVEAACAIVRSWLRELFDGAANDPEEGPAG
jgi:hypothetical protein